MTDSDIFDIIIIRIINLIYLSTTNMNTLSEWKKNHKTPVKITMFDIIVIALVAIGWLIIIKGFANILFK